MSKVVPPADQAVSCSMAAAIPALHPLLAAQLEQAGALSAATAPDAHQWQGFLRLLDKQYARSPGCCEKQELTPAAALSDAELVLGRKIEALGLLAGGIAHDFNNMLAVILACSTMLRHQLKERSGFEEVEEIIQAAECAAALTHQLLVFSRRQVLQIADFELSSVIRDIERLLRRLVGANVRLSLDLRCGSDHVRLDRGQLEQVLVNLATNARDAMPQGGELRIEVDRVLVAQEQALSTGLAPGRYVKIEVTDAGSGMDLPTQRRIFEPFFTTKGGRGTGLGLATVYAIIKQSGGHVSVQSELGHGTSFIIHLPAIAAPAPSASLPPDSALPVGGREVILLVEDDPVVRRSTRRILHAAGYEVLEAADGPAALAMADSARADLLVTDVLMPLMTGCQLVQRMIAARGRLRALYISGYTDDDDPASARATSGPDLLRKPFTRETLLRKVRKALDGPELMASNDECARPPCKRRPLESAPPPSG